MSIVMDNRMANMYLTGLSKLEEFCNKYKYSYGLFEDGSLYVEGYEDNETRWWGRIFETGEMEVNFYRKSNEHLRPTLTKIFQDIIKDNPVPFGAVKKKVELNFLEEKIDNKQVVLKWIIDSIGDENPIDFIADFLSLAKLLMNKELSQAYSSMSTLEQYELLEDLAKYGTEKLLNQ